MLKKIKKTYHATKIKNKQRKVKKQLEEEGFNDDILEKQVAINQLKRKHDISLKEDRIYKNYVQ